jgi:electron transport complex protein RnfG
MGRKRRREFSSWSLVVTLILICGCAGVLLAGVHELTLEPIAKAETEGALRAAVRLVLPEHGNDPIADAASGANAGVYYPARDKLGKLLAIAVPVSDAKGYGGEIKFMIGLDMSGKIRKIQGLDAPGRETPGLGDGIFKEKFLAPLVGQTATSVKWRVKKDGGDVDAVTAATISSRAALRAILSAFAVFEEIGKAPVQTEGAGD